MAKAKKLPKKKTDAQLKKLLDKVFSEYIRLKYADKNGMVKCVTCGAVKHWKEMQNGHYISRQHLAVRWDETNCHPQDASCNIFRGGNYTAYALYMLDKYGEEKLQWLEQQKHIITKYYPYNEKIEYYKEQVKQLLKLQTNII